MLFGEGFECVGVVVDGGGVVLKVGGDASESIVDGDLVDGGGGVFVETGLEGGDACGEFGELGA